MSVLLLVLPLSASLILLMGCLKVGAVVLIVAKLVAVVAIDVAEVSPRRLHGDTASYDTFRRIGVGAGKVVGVDLRHHPSYVCKVVIHPLKEGLADSIVLCSVAGQRLFITWKTLTFSRAHATRDSCGHHGSEPRCTAVC